MSKLYFKYGAMGSSKTANALITKFNYEEKGMSVWLLKPRIDNRDGEKIIKSRIGLQAEADVIENCTPENPTSIFDMFFNKIAQKPISAIIVDECQFLCEKQILDLRKIASLHNTPVLCYGLRTDFRGKLFPGSKALFELADSIAEIKSICKCGEKAIINARIGSNGKVVTDGNLIEIGGNEKYEAMCWKHWYTSTHSKDCK